MRTRRITASRVDRNYSSAASLVVRFDATLFGSVHVHIEGNEKSYCLGAKKTLAEACDELVSQLSILAELKDTLVQKDMEPAWRVGRRNGKN